VPALVAEVLRRFGAARVRAFGSSMLPGIRPGDLLHVRSTTASALATGDVALFVRDGRLFAHRVVGMTAAGRLRTRGDALRHADPAVAPSQVLGAVIRVSRGGREIPCRPVPGGRAWRWLSWRPRAHRCASAVVLPPEGGSY
jgi:hypothetical protein